MRRVERKAWARKVLEALSEVVLPTDDVVVLAGARYREFLLEELRSMCRSVVVPMKGLRIGMQLQWLSDRPRDA